MLVGEVSIKVANLLIVVVPLAVLFLQTCRCQAGPTCVRVDVVCPTGLWSFAMSGPSGSTEPWKWRNRFRSVRDIAYNVVVTATFWSRPFHCVFRCRDSRRPVRFVVVRFSYESHCSGAAMERSFVPMGLEDVVCRFWPQKRSKFENSTQFTCAELLTRLGGPAVRPVAGFYPGMFGGGELPPTKLAIPPPKNFCHVGNYNLNVEVEK